MEDIKGEILEINHKEIRRAMGKINLDKALGADHLSMKPINPKKEIYKIRMLGLNYIEHEILYGK